MCISHFYLYAITHYYLLLLLLLILLYIGNILLKTHSKIALDIIFVYNKSSSSS